MRLVKQSNVHPKYTNDPYVGLLVLHMIYTYFFLFDALDDCCRCHSPSPFCHLPTAMHLAIVCAGCAHHELSA